MRQNFCKFLKLLLSKGFNLSHTKEDIVAQSDLSEFNWKFNEEVINVIESARANGIEIWLVTGSSSHIASFFCQTTGLFVDFHSSDKTTKLKGLTKAEALKLQFGSGNFDYIGDALKDRHVFSVAKTCFAPKRSKKKFIFFGIRHRIIYL
jgi:3-deoxy-D-manno-octulosonate 8-phosphate phosphatase KdsC-like HAD superfamily phosphatase